jgi:hypothetical protein
MGHFECAFYLLGKSLGTRVAKFSVVQETYEHSGYKPKPKLKRSSIFLFMISKQGNCTFYKFTLLKVPPKVLNFSLHDFQTRKLCILQIYPSQVPPKVLALLFEIVESIKPWHSHVYKLSIEVFNVISLGERGPKHLSSKGLRLKSARLKLIP